MPNYRMVLAEKWTNTKQSISSFQFIVKPFLILSGIYALGISTILRTNFNYIDDMGRMALGYKQWDNFSRYLSNFLSSFIHADRYLSDVSPLPKLIAVLLLALSGVLLVYIVSGKKHIPYGITRPAFHWDCRLIFCNAFLISTTRPIWRFRFSRPYFLCCLPGEDTLFIP